LSIAILLIDIREKQYYCSKKVKMPDQERNIAVKNQGFWGKSDNNSGFKFGGVVGWTNERDFSGVAVNDKLKSFTLKGSVAKNNPHLQLHIELTASNKSQILLDLTKGLDTEGEVYRGSARFLKNNKELRITCRFSP
jgi:hypothetical protein